MRQKHRKLSSVLSHPSPVQSKLVQVQDIMPDQDEGEQKKTIHHCWVVTRQINLKSILYKMLQFTS